MNTFVTLSSPHLGYMYSSSKLVDAGIIKLHFHKNLKGMWVLKKWKKTICLDELCMSDSKNIEDTYLMKLSKSIGLAWFKNIIFVSSNQDSYSPYESSRISISKEALKDNQLLKLV